MTDTDHCNFEIFKNSFRYKRNIKKELEQALENRAGRSISNLRLPHLEGKQEKFRISKMFPTFNNSNSLKFNGAERKRI